MWPYLIFVISFTQAGFLNPKFVHPKTMQNTQKLQQIPPKSVKYAVFRVQSGKFYTGQNFLHRHRLWCLWQIWGMLWPPRYVRAWNAQISSCGFPQRHFLLSYSQHVKRKQDEWFQNWLFCKHLTPKVQWAGQLASTSESNFLGPWTGSTISLHTFELPSPFSKHSTTQEVEN